ncbi:SocA family protein [Leptospira sp. 201903071]|uniref:Panacea domain-containing protein n=1 Tax=Leptospira ainazelensis TaxID=2810034 RepID=UPI001963F8F6|nr:Panacea domain-containing protein [Leptospira ainazelensis]MBM9501481.1 SocA family protein [Leptospira ainazelensis]
MIRFKFSEHKATEAVSVLLLQKNSVDRNNYTKILKLLYLIDREALRKWGKPVTGDDLISMPNGTLLSKTYNLIKFHISDTGFWSKYISKKNGYIIELTENPNIRYLSIAELKLIETVVDQYKNYSYSDMITYTHSLPEWSDPRTNGLQVENIDNEDVLKYLDYSIEDIKEIKSETENQNYVKSVLLGE